MATLELNDAYELFIQRLTKVIEFHAPLKSCKLNKRNFRREPWFTRGLQKSSLHCSRLYKKSLGKPKSHASYIKYIEYRNKFNTLKRTAKWEYFQQELNKYRSDIRKTWKILNTLIGKNRYKNSLPNIIMHEGTEIKDKKGIADTFCNYFSNVGEKQAKSIPKSKQRAGVYLGNKPSQKSIYLKPTDPSEIQKIITSMKSKSSSGHDHISSILLKSISDSIIHPLAILLNKSIETGTVPNSLKLAKIIPIHKAKEKELPTNYRPISLLPCISKILEKVIHIRLYNFLNKHGLFYRNQYGFRPNHSTIHAVTDFTIDVTSTLCRKEKCLAVYLDLSKAFDTIQHETLITKLKYYGVRGVALSWFASYLDNRKQFVEFKDTKSDTVNAQSYGVPQGSVLGPLLFIIYTNDLYNSLKFSKAILFADDTTIYVTGSHLQRLCMMLNSDLTELADWFKANKLSLNVSKTRYMLITNNPKDHEKTLNIRIGTDPIIKVHSFKFLGIIIDDKFLWTEHLKNLKSKLSSSLYALNMLKHHLSKFHLKSLYYTLFHTHLIYGCYLWGSASKTDLNPISKLQNRALRIISKVNYNAPTSKLYQINKVLKLNDIYELHLSKFMFLNSNGMLPTSLSHHFCPNRDVHSYNTRQRHDFHLPFNKNKRTANSIQYKGPLLWLNTPPSIKSLSSVNTFTHRLKCHFLSKY